MDIPRTVLLIGIAIVGYLLVLAWNKDYPQSAPHAVTTSQSQVTSAPQSTAAASTSTPSLSGAASSQSDQFKTPEQAKQGQTSKPGVSTSAQTVDQGKTIHVETDLLDARISLQGGNLISVKLNKYKVGVNDDRPMPLLEDDNQRTYVLESALIGKDGIDSAKNGSLPVYHASKSSYTLANGQKELQVDLTYRTDSGVQITKRYTFQRDHYLVKVDYLINNQSAQPWQANFAGKIVRDSSKDPSSHGKITSRSFLGMVLHTPSDPYQKFDFGDLKDKPVDTTVKGGWVAFIQHYFLTAWIPNQNAEHQFQTTTRNNLHVMGFVNPATVVPPDGKATVGAELYVGPKIIDRLKAIAPGLDRTVDYGFLFFIADPLFMILKWFHSLIGNWGVAIILLTVLVKAVFFKLSAASYRSMAKMRAAAPQLQRLKETYGDDRQRMSQEMMNLYKKEKINPLGGCLPILVQMPVFIALYWVLYESVQLRQAPFFLWIHDLSAMDPYFILPILMGISMMVQMSLNPTPPDPIQAKVMKLMPIIFTVFFLWFPAGLVLYWLVNNLLSITQQYIITKQLEKSGLSSR